MVLFSKYNPLRKSDLNEVFMSDSHRLFSNKSAAYINSEADLRTIISASKRTLENLIKKNKNNIFLLQNAFKDSLDSNSESFSYLPDPVKNTLHNPRASFPSLDDTITDERIKAATQELVESILNENSELIEQL